MPTKDEYRRQALAERRALNAVVLSDRSQILADLFFSHFDLSAIRLLHVFLPLVDRGEPDTWIIIRKIQQVQPNIQIAVPKVFDQTLQHFLLEESKISTGSFGIQEPKESTEVAPKEIDLVLVPVLLGDRTGNRLGYGKGFYDRFLSDCRANCLKIGLSILPAVDVIPAESHDIPLDALITPEGVLAFG